MLVGEFIVKGDKKPTFTKDGEFVLHGPSGTSILKKVERNGREWRVTEDGPNSASRTLCSVARATITTALWLRYFPIDDDNMKSLAMLDVNMKRLWTGRLEGWAYPRRQPQSRDYFELDNDCLRPQQPQQPHKLLS